MIKNKLAGYSYVPKGKNKWRKSKMSKRWREKEKRGSFDGNLKFFEIIFR